MNIKYILLKYFCKFLFFSKIFTNSLIKQSAKTEFKENRWYNRGHIKKLKNIILYCIAYISTEVRLHYLALFIMHDMSCRQLRDNAPDAVYNQWLTFLYVVSRDSVSE